MRHISAKLNIYARRVGNPSIVGNDIERIVLRFVLWSFAVLGILYIVLLGNMVRNIVERRTLETNARTLESEVGNLELTYLSMSNNVDLPFSYSLGFKETKATFTTRKALGYIPEGSVKLAQNNI